MEDLKSRRYAMSLENNIDMNLRFRGNPFRRMSLAL
jgi:hypothetical protein